MNSVFLRVLEAEDKAAALLRIIRESEPARGRLRFDVNPRVFESVPHTPFAYWVSDHLRGLFTKLPPFESEGRRTKQGLATADDFRWLRLWQESSVTQRDEAFLVPLAKGGAFSPFYLDVSLGVRWGHGGRWIKEWKADQLHQGLITANNSKCWNENYYFRPGLTWPLRGARFSAQAVPAGCIFSVAGKMAFVPDDMPTAWLALFNSAPFDRFIAFFAGNVSGVQYEAGLIRQVPAPNLPDSDREALARLAGRAWSLKRSLDTRTENSHAFALPALLQVAGTDLAARATTWSEHVRTVEAELIAIQAEIDERCFVLYDINEADRRAMIEGFGADATEAESSEDADETEGDAGEDVEVDDSTTDTAILAAELVSWAVGVALGRFDIRLATGARPMPAEPEPFDPLPHCSPGMLSGEDGLPLARPPARYPLGFSEAGVLVDDPGHALDLATAVRAVFDVVFGPAADHWWNDMAALLDPARHDLRAWLAGSFFEHHIKRYSKSRRKAPVFWQLGTSSGHYSVWLNAHRLNRDSLFQLQNEVMGPKLTHEERQLTSLRQGAGSSQSTSERKEIAAQEAFVEELRTMLDGVKRVAPLWNPDLDDGVVLVMAPLWRLIPQHRPWQKELKNRWDDLAAGKYDWAHLAMHLWPERVVPKCATDRSLAIAHDIEDVFWVEGSGEKWKALAKPVRTVEELVQERSSPAVKKALQDILNAPVSAAEARRRGSARTPSA